MSNLPYLASPGNISKALAGIQTAATPDRVSQDFVKTVLRIPGGSGDQIATFLKRIGFSGGDGRPTERYKKFRNPVTAGIAMSDAIREAYKELFNRNEYAHKLSDDKLKGLIVEVTGSSSDARNVALTLSTIKNLLEYADFEAQVSEIDPVMRKTEVRTEAPETTSQNYPHAQQSVPIPASALGLNIGYTINLNLPATTDIEVFNAIFKSLKENLLSND